MSEHAYTKRDAEGCESKIQMLPVTYGGSLSALESYEWWTVSKGAESRDFCSFECMTKWANKCNIKEAVKA